jgi:hypothetical protein
MLTFFVNTFDIDVCTTRDSSATSEINGSEIGDSTTTATSTFGTFSTDFNVGDFTCDFAGSFFADTFVDGGRFNPVLSLASVLSSAANGDCEGGFNLVLASSACRGDFNLVLS